MEIVLIRFFFFITVWKSLGVLLYGMLIFYPSLGNLSTYIAITCIMEKNNGMEHDIKTYNL